MICVKHNLLQEIEQNGFIRFSVCQSTSCNAQLKNNRIYIHFPGIYSVQWTIVGKLRAAGKFKIQAFNQDLPIIGSNVVAKTAENITCTLTTTPVLLTFQKPTDSIVLSLKNLGGNIVVSDAVMYVQKVF